MRAQTTKWKEDFERERCQNVPLVICRLCNSQFYANKEV